MKAFLQKVWAWIVGHKAIAIAVAAVVVVGSTCAIVLPTALHKHTYSTEWTADATNHWHKATCKHTEEKSDVAAHTYDNACDVDCNVCGYERTAGAHEYDNACDVNCNICGDERVVGAHEYDDNCDVDCNECGATREITHDHATTLTAGEETHWYECSVCGDKKDEEEHEFDQEIVATEYLKEAATDTTKAQYYMSCVCGAKSDTEYFEADKLPADLRVIGDVSKTYDGTPINEPEIDFEGLGGEGFEYYRGTEKLTGRPKDAGTYKVVITIGETETHASDRIEFEVTIAKVVLSNLTYKFTYDGDSYQQAYLTSADHSGIVGSDEIRLEVLFVDERAGANVLTSDPELLPSLEEGNYELDLETFSASIEKKVISNLSFEHVYDGDIAFHTRALTEEDGIVEADLALGIFITIEFNDKDVNSTVKKSYLNISGNVEALENYELDQDTITATITPKKLENVVVYPEYNGTSSWEVEVDHAGVYAGDEVMIYLTGSDKVVGEYTKENRKLGGASLFGAHADNYVVDIEDVTVIVQQKELNLEIYLEYNGGYVPTVTLTEEHGVVGSDDIKLDFADWHSGDYEVGPVYKLTSKLTEPPAGDNTYVGITLTGEGLENYKLVYSETDENRCGTLMITPYEVSFPYNRFTVVQKVDGTNVIVYEGQASNGYYINEDYVIKVPLLDLDGNPITEIGTYTNENAMLGNPEFFKDNGGVYEPTLNLKVPDSFYTNYPFEITLLDNRTLYMQLFTNVGEEVDEDTVKYRGYVVQGALSVGDEITTYVSGMESASKTMTISKLEVEGEEVDCVNGEGEVIFFVENGSVMLAPSASWGIVATHSNEELLKSKVLFINMQYTPDTLAASLAFTGQCSIRFVNQREYLQFSSGTMANEVIGDEDGLAADESGYVKLIFPKDIYYVEGLEIYICPNAETTQVRIIGTATIVAPEKAYKSGSNMMTDDIDLVANQPIIIKLTNEFDTNISQFTFNGNAAQLHVNTNYVVALYSEDGIEDSAVTYDTSSHTFEYADTTTFKLAAGETCYIILIPEGDVEDFYMSVR